MSCQHVWERRDKQPWCLPYYICTECEMELSASQYEAIQQAHRQGWEQATREADSLLLELIDVVLESKPVLQSARKAITSMEYKETTNGL